jgi:hypothetical protein
MVIMLQYYFIIDWRDMKKMWLKLFSRNRWDDGYYFVLSNSFYQEGRPPLLFQIERGRAVPFG